MRPSESKRVGEGEECMIRREEESPCEINGGTVPGGVTACLFPKGYVLPLSWGFGGPVREVARQGLGLEPGQLQTLRPLRACPT